MISSVLCIKGSTFLTNYYFEPLPLSFYTPKYHCLKCYRIIRIHYLRPTPVHDCKLRLANESLYVEVKVGSCPVIFLSLSQVSDYIHHTISMIKYVTDILSFSVPFSTFFSHLWELDDFSRDSLQHWGYTTLHIFSTSNLHDIFTTKLICVIFNNGVAWQLHYCYFKPWLEPLNIKSDSKKSVKFLPIETSDSSPWLNWIRKNHWQWLNSPTPLPPTPCNIKWPVLTLLLLMPVQVVNNSNRYYKTTRSLVQSARR